MKISNYGKLKIGLRRDFKDFAIFVIYFRFFLGSNLGPLDPEAKALSVQPRGLGGSGEKN